MKRRVVASAIALTLPTRMAVIPMPMVSSNLVPTWAHPHEAAKGPGRALNPEQGLVGRARRIFINPSRTAETSELSGHRSATGRLPWSPPVRQLPTGRHTPDSETPGPNSSRCLSLRRTLVHCRRISPSGSLGQHMLGVRQWTAVRPCFIYSLSKTARIAGVGR